MGQPADSTDSSAKCTPVWVIAVPFYGHWCRASELAESLARQGYAVTLLGAQQDVQHFISSRNRTDRSWKRQRYLPIQGLRNRSAEDCGSGCSVRLGVQLSETTSTLGWIERKGLARDSTADAPLSVYSVPGKV
ncbi:hypothetical protein R1flu_011379 [Riccia fluitans]|uniref:Uncharacterized protein n=1 Tax=Riccia fluitans TaxID=41844 RepID=A0ABD1ZAW0_9MARC